MKALSLIGMGVLLLLLGAVPPGYAQEEKQQEAKPQKQEEQAKPEKQQKQQQAKPTKQDKQAQAKPEKREQAKPAKEERQAKSEKQDQAKPAKEEKQAKSEKQAHVQQVKAQQDQQRGQQSQQAQRQWAHNGQKDSRGHEYSESKFGRDHHARFEENGGRFYDGRREYSYGGYWFYAGAYPAWFYQQDVYFIMGEDGLWYAVAYDNPSLMFQVNIE